MKDKKRDIIELQKEKKEQNGDKSRRLCNNNEKNK